jgi:histone-lysine N-methyltransferase SETMAR
LKLRDAIHRKLAGQLARALLLRHEKARPNTVQSIQEIIQELQWEILEHPHYSPNLAPSDLHLCDPLKHRLGGKRFADDEVIETEVRKWLRQRPKNFYAAGFDALVKRWDKCVNAGGGYVQV